MQFLAYCPYCEKKVSASTELDGDALKKALATDATIRIIHLPTGGPDHVWNMNAQEKKNLLGQLRV